MQQVVVDRKFIMKPGAIFEGSFGNMFDRGGRTYYVNNVTGDDANTGLSWKQAKAQPQAAIDAAAIFLALNTPSPNDDGEEGSWIRNTIVIQGTNADYEKITAAPNACDMIGLGTFKGIGSWGSVARIGSATTAMTGDSRGMGLFNLRFESWGGSAYNIISIVNSLGMQMEDCAIMSNEANGTTALKAAIGGTNVVWAGHCIRNSRIGGASGSLGCSIGIDLGANPTTWNNCLIENNIIEGITYGIKGNPLANAQGTLITNNNIFGQAYGEAVLSAVGIVCSKYLHTSNNFISAADGLSEDETYQSVGNTIVTS